MVLFAVCILTFRCRSSLYCLDDYRKYVADKCEGCGAVIEEGKTFTTQGHTFHESCFICEACDAQLGEDKPFFPELRSVTPPPSSSETDPNVTAAAIPATSSSSSSSSTSSTLSSESSHKRKRSGKEESTDEKEHKSRVLLLCSRCKFRDNQENAPCARCDDIIEGEGIFALGKRYHQECFTCLDCQKPLIEKGEFFEVDDRLYCRDPQCVFMREQRENASKRRKLGLLGILSTPLSALRQAKAEQQEDAPESPEVAPDEMAEEEEEEAVDADTEESDEHLIADTEL